MTLEDRAARAAALRAEAAALEAPNQNGSGGPASWGAPPQQQPGWGAPPPPAGGTAPQGLLVPLKLNAPNGGTLRVYVQFGPDAAASPEAVMAAISALANAGAPVDVYVPKQQNGWSGGNRGGYGGGGYRGGYQNGGGYDNQRRW